MIPDRPSRFENRQLRRVIIAFTATPPVALGTVAALGSKDLTASIALMCAAMLALVALLLDFTLEAAAAERRRVRVFRTDDEALTQLVAEVHSLRPKTADLLEYSALGAMPLLSALSEEGSVKRVRLLVCHPDSAISDYQRDVRLAEGLRTLAYRVPIDLVQRCGLEVRCYRDRASLRGRLLGKFNLAVGWYTYDDRGMPDPGGAQMSGGTNATVLLDDSQDGAKDLIAMFRRVFENHWRNAEPIDLAWMDHRSHLAQLPSAEWMQAVSQQRGG